MAIAGSRALLRFATAKGNVTMKQSKSYFPAICSDTLRRECIFFTSCGHQKAMSSTVAAVPLDLQNDDEEFQGENSSGGLASDLIFRYPDQVVAPTATFRMMEQDGSLRSGAEKHMPAFSPDEWRTMYKFMVRVKEMDKVFMSSQRQGRISFYMTSIGEEALQIGSAAALSADDVVLAQYREVGVFLWRGFGIQSVADQLFSNEADKGKGRQMPMHFGSKDLKIQTISSPLGTQLPQAVGAGYSLKLEGGDNISVCYFGEGAASEGDFHAALNFASTLDVPMIFFCRNNGYAISTPTHEQFRGDGIASRAIGYNIPAIRVDGNDLAAVFTATRGE